MKTKDAIKQVLEKWGFPVVQETETSVVYRYQMSFIQTNVSSESDEGAAVTVTYTGLFKADDDKEMIIGLRTCNDLNYNMMQVKLYIDSDSDLTIAGEFFIPDEEQLEYQLSMALKAVMGAKRKFTARYRQFKEEADLLEELNDTES